MNLHENCDPVSDVFENTIVFCVFFVIDILRSFETKSKFKSKCTKDESRHRSTDNLY